MIIEQKRDNCLLPMEQTHAMKGILAICVFAHHLYGWVNILRIPPFNIVMDAPLGYWSVSLFFLFSGWGLYDSLKRKGKDYVNGFARNRILPFFIISAILILLYTVLNLTICDYEQVSARLVFQSFLIWDTVVKNGWYIQTQMLLYIAFYFISWLAVVKRRKSMSAVILPMTLFVIVYIAVCYILKIDVYWYQTVPAFVIGICLRELKEKFTCSANSKKVKALIASAVLFAVTFVLAFFVARWGYETFSTGIRIISILSFDIMIVLILYFTSSRKIYRNAILKFLGRISLGIYVLQGGIMCILRGPIIHISNDWIFTLLCLILSILCAAAFTPLIERIYKLCKYKEK